MFKPFNYGDVVTTAENVKTSQQNSLLNQQKTEMGKQEMLYLGASQIAENPESARHVIPKLQEMGIMRMGNQWEAQSPQAIQAGAIKIRDSVGKSLQGLNALNLKGATTPASVLETQWLQKQSPETQSLHMRQKRAQKLYDRGSEFQGLDPLTGQPSNVTIPKDLAPTKKPDYIQRAAGAGEQGKQDVIREMKPGTEAEVIKAKYRAELETGRPKADMKISATDTKTGMLKKLITKAKSQANFWTTGFYGSKASEIAGTDAHDLMNTMNTIKANIGFDKPSYMPLLLLSSTIQGKPRASREAN